MIGFFKTYAVTACWSLAGIGVTGFLVVLHAT